MFLYLGFQEVNKIFLNVVTSPRPINLPLKNSTTEVISIAAGRAHLLILTNEGVFTLGNNGYGQCGRPIIPNENYSNSNVVYHIPSIKGNRITGITAGQDHRYKANSFHWNYLLICLYM